MITHMLAQWHPIQRMYLPLDQNALSWKWHMSYQTSSMIELIPYTGFIVNEKKYIAFHFHEFIFDWSQILTLLLFHSPGLPQLLYFQRKHYNVNVIFENSLFMVTTIGQKILKIFSVISHFLAKWQANSNWK